ncbi:AfsR/SARP family transcriptional regulator [Trujillonella humicola]|uniref:AfsR/SARP family transcriptional regulator n=1 Tax=Trujillonella humicola TaxID=3383699 RepID=UPI003905DB7F
MPAVAVLGPVLLEGVPLRSERQRRLLSALVAAAPHGVSADALVDRIWPGTPPADPGGALQTVVARLRRALPPAVRVETLPTGYRLVAPGGEVDVTAFTEAVADDGGGPTQRLARLDAALALWRGRPYPDLEGPDAEPAAAALEGLRAEAAEARGRVLLELGRTADAVAAAEALVAEQPLREGAVALLARALAGCGRQAEAVAALAALRRRLADELGLDPSPQLRRLESQVLRQELEPVVAPAAPPPPAPAARPTPPPLPVPVPVPVSSLVGRDGDLATVDVLLARCRVVTLCGPGGVGKTRLARHVAAAVAGRYADGVVLVEFGRGSGDDVQPAVAAALRVAGTGSEPVVDRVLSVLTVRRQLLLLDNCEHVADEVAALVEAVVMAAPGVDVLATSREALRVDGEHVHPVQPLAEIEAVALLRARVAAQHPDAVLDGEPVARLCRRLDGLPLALELAAARIGVLGVGGLLEALESSDGEVLAGGRRTAAPRHRSLREVVAWSHRLLDPRQQRLFERLAVFAGPVERAAVAAVCGDAAALPELVERSLVVRVPGTPARFGMLETLRAFGRARLARDPALPALRARHAAWAVALAEEVCAGRRGPAEPAAVARFDAHLADLRRAHAWLCEHGPVEDLLRLSQPAAELAWLRGRADLVLMTERALTVAGVLDPATRTARPPGHPLAVRLLGLLATSGWQRGEFDRAEQWARAAITAGGDTGDTAATAATGWAHEALANVHTFRGEVAAGRRAAAAAAALGAASGDVELELAAVVDELLADTYAGDDATAAADEAALLQLAARLDSPTGHAWAAYARGERRAERSEPDAESCLREAVARAEAADSSFVAGIARHTLLTAGLRRHAAGSRGLVELRSLVDTWHRLGAWTQLWVAVRALVEALARDGRCRDAAVLLGALRASQRAPRPFGADSGREAEAERRLRAALGPAAEAALAEGAALGDAGAIALALRVTHPAPA